MSGRIWIEIGTLACVALLLRTSRWRARRNVDRLTSALASASDERRQAEIESSALLSAVHEGVVIFGPDMRVLRCNEAAAQILAADGDEIEGWKKAFPDMIDVDGRPIGREMRPVERAFATRSAQRDVTFGCGPENRRRWFVASATPVGPAVDAGDLGSVILCLREITQHRSVDVEGQAFAKRLRALHAIATATTENDRSRIESALHFALDELGLDQAYLGAVDEQTGELVMQNVLARDAEPSYGAGKRYPLKSTLIGRVVESDEVFAAPNVVEARAAHGIEYNDEWRSYIASAIRFAGRRYGAIGFKGRTVRSEPFSSIDVEFVRLTGDLIAAAVERGLQRERLAALAFYDSLTALPNRVLLMDRLSQCIIAARRQDTGFALLFIDLDGFKRVNDLLGHASGDEVLKAFAVRLTAAAREGDTVARLGGDEFVILAPNIETTRDARDFAQRIVSSARYCIAYDGGSLEVTASIGVSLFPDNGTDATVLLNCADAAMFAAKLSGNGDIGIAPQLQPVIH